MTPAQAAAQRLRVDYAAGEVLRAFEAEAIESIVLKGAPLVRWLYGPGERRSYADCDLLVAPAALSGAGEVLGRLGFLPELDEAEMPEWWRSHGTEWFRRTDGAAVDLHRTLPGAEADPAHVWDVLSARTQPVEIGGTPARSLDVPGLALQVALHAAQHGGLTRHVRELELALEKTDEDTWREAARLAGELNAGAALATGLRFTEPGAELADRLDLPAVGGTEAVLRSQGLAEPLTVERFAQGGTRTRISIAGHKLFPPATFMRKWSPLASRGRLGLALAYLWRPFWLLRRMPRAIRGWRSARRTAKGS